MQRLEAQRQTRRDAAAAESGVGGHQIERHGRAEVDHQHVAPRIERRGPHGCGQTVAPERRGGEIEKDPTATKFDDITYDEVLKRGLKVMDLTATCMCKENNLPIIVFDMDTVGNLKKVMTGENIGTLVHN